MPEFEPRDPAFDARVRRSFDAQAFVGYLGARLVTCKAGEVDISLPFKSHLAQQHGFVHGGAITTIADAAAGYAAMTLAGPGIEVLTSDLKVSFLRPAGKGELIARGRVIKPGRTLTICQVDVAELPTAERAERHVLTGLVTMMFVEGLAA